MTRLFAAELLKLRTIRGTWGYVLTAAGLAALITAGTIGSATEADRLGAGFQSGLVRDAAGPTAILALLFGIALVTNEFRHGTIAPALLVAPRRARLLVAKLLAGVAAGLALVVAALIVIAAVALVWLGLVDVPLQLRDALEPLGRILVAASIGGALGAAYGGLIHAQVPALVGALVWMLVAEPLLGGLLGLVDAGGAADYLPASIVFAIADPSSGGLPFGAAVGAGLAHLAGTAALAWLRTNGRDIT